MELLSPIEQLCEELKLPVVAQEYNNLSIIASQENWKYSQFLEELLQQEYNEKMKQRRNEIQQAEDRFVKERIKAFFVGWAIFALVFIIYFLH